MGAIAPPPFDPCCLDDRFYIVKELPVRPGPIVSLERITGSLEIQGKTGVVLIKGCIAILR
jgi:hypothetical protein